MPAANRFPRRRFLAWSGAATVSGVAAYLGLSGQDGPIAADTRTTAKPSAAEKTPTTEPSAAAPSGKPAAAPSGPFQREAFLARLNSEFRIGLPDVTAGACKLVEVSPATEMNTPRGRFTCFSLGFEARGGFPEEGAICRVSHPSMEDMEIFLSPVGRQTADKALLEAVFTLRV